MTTIVTRAGKGSALTFTEGDANFTNLNNDKLELTDLSVGTEGSPSGDGSLSYNNTTGVFTYTPPTAAGIGALANVVEDTTPQLGGTLDGQANTISNVNLKDYKETNYALSYSATLTPDVANGNVQTVTLTGNVTFSAFANPESGQSLTLIVKQDATGSRTLTSTMKFAGADKTLSTAANSIDIISVFYDGTNYYASLAKGFA